MGVLFGSSFAFYHASALFFMRNEAQGAHPWLEIYPVSKFQSDWCTECNASLAGEKKERKKEYEKSSVAHTF